ncbi:MAG: acetone carboxylase subunit gamma [Deltaproteobacteria bacterium]|nr:acetone carboxylase subunit gamma [Deltaproteobacteria bacterium]
MPQYDITEIEKLVDGRLPWPRVQEIMKDSKDTDRFHKWVEILQSRVSWRERILLPIGPNLFIVQKGRERIVKCRCGHELGDYRVNWKLSALIHIRDTPEELAAVYRGSEQPDTAWTQLREYYCPGCGGQLEVEAVPRGCPPDFEFLPDLDTFYRDWLGKPLPNEVEFVDKTLETVKTWST